MTDGGRQVETGKNADTSNEDPPLSAEPAKEGEQVEAVEMVDAGEPVESSLPDALPGEAPHLDPEDLGGVSQGSFREAGATPQLGDRRKRGGPPRREDLSVPPEELGSRLLEDATEADPDPHG